MTDRQSVNHYDTLWTFYSLTRTWSVTKAITGLSPPAGYLYEPWDKAALKYNLYLGSTSTLTITALALCKDIHLYQEP